MSVLDDLANALRLLQTPGKDAAKNWAWQTRQLMREEKKTLDHAATTAAKAVFSEFDPLKYKVGSVDEALLKRIEAF